MLLEIGEVTEMTYDQIATFYRTRMGIQSERSVKQLAECTRFIPRKKGDRLRVAGEEMTSILFLMNGVARTYVIDDDGYESIMGFCYKPGRVCYGAAGVQDKYSLNVEAVTDIDTLELPITNLIHVMNRDPQVGQIVRQDMRDLHDIDIQWQIATKTKSGEERYKWFLKEYAPIVGIVTQKDIASFLGLRAQSLSRIKTTMEKKQKS